MGTESVKPQFMLKENLDIQKYAYAYDQGNVLNCVQKVLEIKKGHGKKVCVDQNTDLHPLGGNHDPWQEV